MSCNGCFDGCVETTSDQCVKYTGDNIPELGIETGDSLASIESAITTNLLTALDGTGIIMTIEPSIICDLVAGYLPSSGDVTLVDYISALIASVCEVNDVVITNTADISTIEADYVVECITAVGPEDGTHAVLQAVINYLCEFRTEYNAFKLEVETNYAKIVVLDGYIQTYLNTIGAATTIKDRMVPNTAVEYYGALGFFDGTGKGLGDWDQIYLCNGLNGTPDKRGRVPVGVTTGMYGGVYSPVVDPSVVGNPNYTNLSSGGSNTVTLIETQMPLHTHTGSTDSTSLAHAHQTVTLVTATGALNNGNAIAQNYSSGGNLGYSLHGAPSNANAGRTNSGDLGNKSFTFTTNTTGSNEGHANIQPSLACYYIIYIPTP